MKVVYLGEEVPKEFSHSIFLFGTMNKNGKSWRDEFCNYLEENGYNGVVFNPEPRDKNYDFQYGKAHIKWEFDVQNMSDIYVFWIDRDNKNVGLTTNVDFGRTVKIRNVIYGRPKDKVQEEMYLDNLYKSEFPMRDIPETLYELSADVMDEINNISPDKNDKRSPRRDGERYIPLNVWNLDQFKKWYRNHTKIGNRIDNAKLLWNFKPAKSEKIFIYSMWVNIWIQAEKRFKSNEFIISRTDISSTLLLHENKNCPLESKVVLVKEFRSPVNNDECFIYELPSGSTFKPNKTVEEIAVGELKEETGLIVDPKRLIKIKERQLAGTLSTHTSSLFCVHITDDELHQIESIPNDDANILTNPRTVNKTNKANNEFQIPALYKP
jgi:ADP-ribose pyrophosphatase YjhB (NUDIX family)